MIEIERASITKATRLPYSPAARSTIAEAVAETIRTGGVVALPTESFYALAVSPFSVTALARVRRMKGRADKKPILVLIANEMQLQRLVRNVPTAARLLMERFWPGPLTLVCAAAAGLPDELTAGTGSVGVRLSAYGPLTELLEVVGPVTGTSANRSGAPPLVSGRDVQALLGAEIDLLVDAGTTAGGLPSTVVDVQERVKLVREGRIGRETLEQVLRAHEITLHG
jgi:L-threonylcarbamoyladenylate synthase